MIVYHGTKQTDANSIITHIDVKLGGGELGRGFYVGQAIALAAAFSRGKHGNNGAVVKFEIDDSAYCRLHTITLNHRQFLYNSWQSLIRRRRTQTHLFGFDVVCAPFATIEFSHQYKFESTNAENTINNSTKQIL